MTSISSEPFGHLEDDLNEDGDSNKKGEMALQDGVIKTYDDHEDSVRIISFSANMYICQSSFYYNESWKKNIRSLKWTLSLLDILTTS